MTLGYDKSEKRRYPRLPVSIRIEGQWADLEGGRKRKLTALLLAVSEGGALLRCAQPIAANSKIFFSFRIGMLRQIEIRATVRWWRQSGDLRELGIEFAKPVRRLGAYVEKQLAAADNEPLPRKALKLVKT